MTNELAVTRRDQIVWLDQIGLSDLPLVGGKNAALGEMVRALGPLGVHVPAGFAVTTEAYRAFLGTDGLEDAIRVELDRLGSTPVADVAVAIRRRMLKTPLPVGLREELRAAYVRLSEDAGSYPTDVAVRSSATAEDLPDASFAGQLESFLHVRGEDPLADAVLCCWSSLFTDRAIAYRMERGYDHASILVSVGVQVMVPADSAGVAFTVDPETGFPDVVVIESTWGLGETVAAGAVTPDEHVVFKPLLRREGRVPIVERTLGSKQLKRVAADDGGTRDVETTAAERGSFALSDHDVLEIAWLATAIEKHWERAVDVEWVRDGAGRVWVVQARPETVHAERDGVVLVHHELRERGRRLLGGLAVGGAIASGEVCLIDGPEDIDLFRPGAVLVTRMTDPDWGPILRQAAAIVTDQGGRTSHAAIVARELGIPAIVGTGRATRILVDGRAVTVSCAEGDRGSVYEGELAFAERSERLDGVPATRTPVMLNLACPDEAFRWWRLPADGVGLLRMESLIDAFIGVHPMALAHFDAMKDGERRLIEAITEGYDDPTAALVDRIATGIAKIAASQWPRKVVVRTSDFKTNEFANLIGGSLFEPTEENPMLGFRGACRYVSDAYREGFVLECRAIRRVREEIGLDNVVVMIPFCRTPEEADRVLAVMDEAGLARGKNGLEVWVMGEVPSNVILAEEFAERFDGFSIGSDDLTQLVLGVDRGNAALGSLFDPRHPAVTRTIEELVRRAHGAGASVGFCGRTPSDDAGFTRFLVRIGVDSISVTPDALITTKRAVGAAEETAEAGKDAAG